MTSPSVPFTSSLNAHNPTSVGGTSSTVNAQDCCCYTQYPTTDKIPSGKRGAFRAQTSEQSSSGCQWSAEEQVLERQFASDAFKMDNSFMYSGMRDPSSMRTPYMYDRYEYEYDFTHHEMHHHSPSLGHRFGRHHHGKSGGDPTFILSLVRWARIGSSRVSGDDDQIDRLNYQITSLILLLLIALTGMRQYLSHLPLQCWIPQEFSRSWEEYAEHFCWVTQTYFSNVQARLPPVEERKNVVCYYQWATFVLVLQAAGFFLPCIVWRLFQNYSGLNVQRIMRSATQLNCAPASTVATAIPGLARYIDAVTYQRQYKFWQRHATKYWSTVSAKSNKATSSKSSGRHVPVVSEPPSRSMEKSGKNVHFHTPSKSRSQSGESTLRRQAPPPPTSTTVQRTELQPNPPLLSTLSHTTSSSGTLGRGHGKSPAPAPPSTDTVIEQESHTVATTTRLRVKPTEKSGEVKKQRSNSVECFPMFGSRNCQLCCLSRDRLSGSRRSSKLGAPITKPPGESRSQLIPSAPVHISSTTSMHEDKKKHHKNQRVHPTTSWCCPLTACSCCPPKVSIKTPYTSPAAAAAAASLTRTHRRQSDKRLRRCLQYTGRQLASLLYLTGRLLFSLVCIIPGCLCHWLRGTTRIRCVDKSSRFLFYLYATIKLGYLCNLIGQLWFMQLFLGTESMLFGLLVLRDLIHGRAWSQTGNFPRVTYCDFETKKTGKNYKYTLQCVLPLNLFLEKVYVFLWFWMVFVTLLTIYSLFKWLSRMSIPQSRHNFIYKLLIPWRYSLGCEHTQHMDRTSLTMFVDKYLDWNGVFLLWLVSINAGELVAGELISALWDLFLARLASATNNSQKSIEPPTNAPTLTATIGEKTNIGSDNNGSSAHGGTDASGCSQTIFNMTPIGTPEVKWHSTSQLSNAIHPLYTRSKWPEWLNTDSPHIPDRASIPSETGRFYASSGALNAAMTHTADVTEHGAPVLSCTIDSSLDSIV